MDGGSLFIIRCGSSHQKYCCCFISFVFLQMKRAYNDLSVVMFGRTPTFPIKAAESLSVAVWVINDLPSMPGAEAEDMEVVVSLLPWLGVASPVELWRGDVRSARGSSKQATEISLSIENKLYSQSGCSFGSCVLKATLASKKYHEPQFQLEFSPTYFFLTPIKNAALDSSVSVKLTEITQLSAHEFECVVTTSATSPFLFLELNNMIGVEPGVGANTKLGVTTAAGWFSDNNFVAEANVPYRIQYTAFHSDSLTLKQFESSLQVRTLQDVYRC